MQFSLLENVKISKLMTLAFFLQAGNPEIEENFSNAQSSHVLNGTSDNQEVKQLAEQMGLHKQQHENTSSHASINNKSERILESSSLDVSIKTADTYSKLYKKSDLAQAFEVSKGSETIDLNVEKVTGNSLLGESNADYSTSILEKLFGSALTLNSGGSSIPLEVVMVSSYILVLHSLCSLNFIYS